MNRRTRIKKDTIIIFMLFFSLFKIAVIPSTIRQIIKLFSVIVIFFLVCLRLPKKRLVNISLLYSCSMLLSGFINYFSHKVALLSLLETLLNAILFYDLYALILYFYLNKKMYVCLKNIYKINLLACVINTISIFFIRSSYEGEIIYFFGNKFASAYLYILLIALFGAVHDMSLKKNKRRLYLLIFATLVITCYIRVITAFVSVLIILLLITIKRIIQPLVVNPLMVIIALLSSSITVFVFDDLLRIGYIRNFIFNSLGKSASIGGRLEIYNIHLKKIISSSIVFGHGYNNRLIYTMSEGIFGNAQNGMFEQFVSYGIVGTLSIVIITYCCFKGHKHNNVTYYLSLVVYAMIIAATIEVTINWFFFLGICLVKFSNFYNSTNIIYKRTAVEKGKEYRNKQFDNSI